MTDEEIIAELRRIEANIGNVEHALNRVKNDVTQLRRRMKRRLTQDDWPKSGWPARKGMGE